MSAARGRTALIRVAVVVVALAAATLVEVVADASVPGRMPLFAFGATIVLVFGAKQLGRLIQRPLSAEEIESEHLPAGRVAEEVHDG